MYGIKLIVANLKHARTLKPKLHSEKVKNNYVVKMRRLNRCIWEKGNMSEGIPAEQEEACGTFHWRTSRRGLDSPGGTFPAANIIL